MGPTLTIGRVARPLVGYIAKLLELLGAR
jgi:hypothetical protein